MKTTIHIRKQLFTVVTVEGEKSVEINGTEKQARVAIRKAGDMLVKEYLGERVDTYKIDLETVEKYGEKVKKTEDSEETEETDINE